MVNPRNPNNNDGTATGQSGFATKYLQGLDTVNKNLNVTGTKMIDGQMMTLSQAINYFNTTRIKDYSGKYQSLKNITGYSGKSDQTAFGYWNAFVRDFFASPESDFNTYASQRGTSGGGTTSAAYPSITSEENARFDFQQLLKETVGPAAVFNEKDFKNYYKQLIALEKNRPTKQITTTSGGRTIQTTIGGVSDLEKQQLALTYVAKYLNVGDPKVVGGTIAANQAIIGKLAADYGINIPDSEVRRNAITSVTGGQTAMDSIQSKIKLLAKALYPSLSNLIDAGLSVADVASSYIAEKANILELNPSSINLKDPDIVQAISGQSTENIADFRKRMKSSSLYSKTNNALNDVQAMIAPIKAAVERRSV